MGWITYDDTLAYVPNFASRVATHGSGGLVWISNNESPPNYAIQYDIASKTENIISLEIALGGINYKGSNSGNFAIASDGTNIFGVSQHSPDLAGGGADHPVWDHSTGTNWTEAIDLGANAGAYQVRMFYSDGRFYIPKSWTDLSTNPKVLCWTSPDGINWSGEQTSPAINTTAFSGRFLNNPPPVFAKLTNGNAYVSGTLSNSIWQFFKRVGTAWVKTGVQMSSFSFSGVDMFAMGESEAFSRLYRRVISGTQRLQYSEDEGSTWNDCITDNAETVLTSDMGGAVVVYAHSGREFISFNREISPINHVYSLYEFNAITKEFDYVDDMPNDSNSFQGAFVYNNELYIHHSGNIYKHDGLSFGEVVSGEFDLRVATPNRDKHSMDIVFDGSNIAFALEDDNSGVQKTYLVDSLDLTQSIIFTSTSGGSSCVYRVPAANQVFITGTFDNKNAKVWDIDTSTLTDISFGTSDIQPAIISRQSKVYAMKSNGDILSRSSNGTWVDEGLSSNFINGTYAIDAIFLDGFIPDYIFMAGADGNGDMNIVFSPNLLESISDLGGAIAFPTAGTPVITGLDAGFDG